MSGRSEEAHPTASPATLMSDRRLHLALVLARRGGRLAAAWRGRAQVSWKDPGDRVTEVDRAIQSRIVDEIRGQFPQDAVVAEEGAAFRRFGSVALHLVYAAVGALDIVLDHTAKLWDMAAGTAILLEGGAATDPGGRSLFPATASAYGGDPMPILAGNRSAHAQALVRLSRGGRRGESRLVSGRSPR